MRTLSDSLRQDMAQTGFDGNIAQDLKEGHRLLQRVKQALQEQQHPYLAEDLVGVRRDFNRLICFFKHNTSLLRFKMLQTKLLQQLTGEQLGFIEARVAPALQPKLKPTPIPKQLSDKTKQDLQQKLSQIESPHLKTLFESMLKRS